MSLGALEVDIGEYYPQTQEVGLTAGAQGNFGGGITRSGARSG